jgi:Fic family protein
MDLTGVHNSHARLGQYVTTSVANEVVQAFIPPLLPPEPPLQLTNEDYELLEKANRALGRLDGITTLLPDTALFIYMYVRKEALLSSQIEGTQSSLSDLLLFEHDEMPGVPLNDVQEVSNYVRALQYGLDRLHQDNFPLSARLIREIHEVLMQKGRGSTRAPGEFRRSQNWLGGTRLGNARFVPPPHEYVVDLITNLENFLHDRYGRTPTLIKAALAHVQFETIHPFLDGNGRLGRLLITLLLCAEKALAEPTLYLSLFFKTHRDIYYDLLQQVRTEGAWEEWLRFFLEGVETTAQQAFQTVQALIELFARDRQRIESLGRTAGSALQVHQYLQRHTFIAVPDAVKALNLSAPTITQAVKNLEELGIVREVTGKMRHRLWFYQQYLAILNEGAEPLGL